MFPKGFFVSERIFCFRNHFLFLYFLFLDFLLLTFLFLDFLFLDFLFPRLLNPTFFVQEGHMNFQVLNQDFQKQKRNKTKFMEAIKTTTKIPDFEGKLNELFSQGRK